MQSSKQNAAGAFMQAILNSKKNMKQGEQSIQMPELALRCAQFFHSISQYCLYFYKNYNREADIHKTKLIKKVDKSQLNDNKRFKYGQRGFKNQRGQNQPQPPKKPLTAYIIYFQDKKPSFAQKFPSLSLSELTKLIAKDWKDLTDLEKKPYLDKAADDRKRYQIQLNQFRKKYQSQEGIEGNIPIIQEQKKQFQQQKQVPQIIAQILQNLDPSQLHNKQQQNQESPQSEQSNNQQQQNVQDQQEQNQSPQDIQNQQSEEEKIQQEQ